jgi:hypothetical protein
MHLFSEVTRQWSQRIGHVLAAIGTSILIMACHGARSDFRHPASPETAIAMARAPRDPSATLAACMEQTALPLVVHEEIAFVDVGLKGPSGSRVQGPFLLDFGATATSIDANHHAFKSDPVPSDTKPCFNNKSCVPGAAGSSCNFDGFDFFGGWGAVCLAQVDMSTAPSVGGGDSALRKQAGILGADFLTYAPFALDYRNKKMMRGRILCDRNELENAGFAQISTRGFFSQDRSRGLYGMRRFRSSAGPDELVPNVPTIQIRLGGTTLLAQLDSGYNDHKYRHAININRAAYEQLVASGTQLVSFDLPPAERMFPTCKGADQVNAYRLPNGSALTFVSDRGETIASYADVFVFVKEPTEESRACFGIATWNYPAGQLGNSFMIDAGVVLYEPQSESVQLLRHAP